MLLSAPFNLKAQSFTIADIIVDGYQRISPGIIYNLLPVGIGDQVTASTSRADNPRTSSIRIL